MATAINIGLKFSARHWIRRLLAPVRLSQVTELLRFIASFQLCYCISICNGVQTKEDV